MLLGMFTGSVRREGGVGKTLHGGKGDQAPPDHFKASLYPVFCYSHFMPLLFRALPIDGS